MKTLFLFLTLFFSQHIIYAQIESGTITYGVEVPKTFKKSIDTTNVDINNPIIKDVFKKSYIDFKKAAPYITHKFDFNSEKAIGTSNSGMANDSGLDFNMALETAYAIGEYVIDFTKNSSTHQFKDSNKLLRVYRPTDSLKWKLENEYKTILGYKCQKATAQYSFNYLAENEITAWFTSELPFQAGPIGISGLPGAILKLDKRNFSYYATDINLEKTKTPLKPSEKGKLMSIKEYQNYIFEKDPKAKDFFEKYKNQE